VTSKKPARKSRSDVIKEMFSFWAAANAKDLQRVRFSPDRKIILDAALKRYDQLTVELALAWGAVSPFHWENGHNDLHTLLLPPARLERNAVACREKIHERVIWFSEKFGDLREEVQARNIEQGERGNSDIAQLASLKRKLTLASMQGEALETLAERAWKRESAVKKLPKKRAVKPARKTA